ncbi:hypothetical protein H0H93_010403 [Arthromyces matolae]|nr:hypothetical protein H0H93_010403 [Arthromyces matolae]
MSSEERGQLIAILKEGCESKRISVVTEVARHPKFSHMVMEPSIGPIKWHLVGRDNLLKENIINSRGEPTKQMVFTKGYFALLSGLLLAARVSGQTTASQWGQCAGIGWAGATLCPTGWVCTYLNDYYSQCLQGTSTTTTSASKTTTTTTTSSTSKTTTTTTTNTSKTTTSSSTVSTTSTTTSSAASGTATLLSGYSWIRAVEDPNFHQYLRSEVINTASTAVLGDPSTAGQFQITNGQLIQYAGGTPLYAVVENQANSTVTKLLMSWSTTPATSGTFVFSGDTLEWSIPTITRPQTNIGTPLPPLEKSKDLGEFVPLWKQDVRDEKGRRRLHGAFTGGFSAGYFNTVGSKEGWTPSTFVSSRGDRAKQKVARPEDFMDEEDLQELKDSRKIVDTTDEMDFAAGNKAVDDQENDSLTSALQNFLLPPPTDSAGARILKKMGWRLGQGIGPRISLRKRKLQDLDISFGRRVSSELANIPDDDEEASKHTYAPRDTPLLAVERKENSHGLGYKPGMGLQESVSGKAGAENAKGPQISAGFGLGALNDADDDDVDVYEGAASSSNRRRVAYDIADHEQDDPIAVQRRKDKQVKGSDKTASASSVAYFRDGQPVIPGFVLAEKTVTDDVWFPMPDVPPGWKPDPRRVWDKGFQPFLSDPEKHLRYNTYLRSQLATDAGPPLQPHSNQSRDEFHKECEGYAKAALLFKPMSNAMAGRFTSAAVVETGPKMHVGLHTPSQEESKHKEGEEKKEEENLSPKANAARMGMYGPLTREAKPWQPAKLLCKRFKVRDPNPEPEVEVPPPAAAPGSNWQQAEIPMTSIDGAGSGSGDAAYSGTSARDGPRDISNIGLGEDDSQGRDTLTYERPTMDVFKAIFASDEEDSDDDKGKDDEDDEVVEPPAVIATTSNLEPSSSIPPPPAPAVVAAAEPLDLNTFKPTFIPREVKAKKEKDTGKVGDNDQLKKEKKEKRKREKEKERRGVLSFALDEEGGEGLEVKPAKDRPPKKKKQKKERNARGEEDEDEGMWVEKPAADAVKNLVVPLPPSTVHEDTENVPEPAPTRGRKRAVDFL